MSFIASISKCFCLCILAILLTGCGVRHESPSLSVVPQLRSNELAFALTFTNATKDHVYVWDKSLPLRPGRAENAAYVYFAGDRTLVVYLGFVNAPQGLITEVFPAASLVRVNAGESLRREVSVPLPLKEDVEYYSMYRTMPPIDGSAATRRDQYIVDKIVIMWGYWSGNAIKMKQIKQPPLQLAGEQPPERIKIGMGEAVELSKLSFTEKKVALTRLMTDRRAVFGESVSLMELQQFVMVEVNSTLFRVHLAEKLPEE